MVGTGRFELPTPRTPSECSTRLSHVPTRKEPAPNAFVADGVQLKDFITRGLFWFGLNEILVVAQFDLSVRLVDREALHSACRTARFSMTP
jgi:hypothetical protein